MFAVALLLLPNLFMAPRDGDVTLRHYNVNGWRLEVRSDRFSQQRTCLIQRHDVTYDHGVVTFRFSHRVDTANALFRVDNGPVRPAVSVAVQAAGLGARMSGPGLANPSDGAVHIPAAQLGDAMTVAIQPNPRTSHRSFDLRGLTDALAAAGARGCSIG